jgi:UDP-2-acetamido-2,6-beta-L-arabino-hexul-4-ose reductase
MSLRIGITGFNGFIAQHISSNLKKNEDIKVYGYGHPKEDLMDPKSISRFVADKDIIIHAAAVNRGSDMEVIEGSIIATRNLISAMVKSHKKIKKIIFLSSVQAETETLYGLSKKMAERMLEEFSREYKIPVTVLRLTNVFGEGCRPFYNSVVATFCYQTTRDKKLLINNSRRKLNLIYIGNIVSLIMRETFNIKKKVFRLRRVVSNNNITIANLAVLIQSFKKLDSSDRLKSKFHKDLYNTFLSHKS